MLYSEAERVKSRLIVPGDVVYIMWINDAVGMSLSAAQILTKTYELTQVNAQVVQCGHAFVISAMPCEKVARSVDERIEFTLVCYDGAVRIIRHWCREHMLRAFSSANLFA